MFTVDAALYYPASHHQPIPLNQSRSLKKRNEFSSIDTFSFFMRLLGPLEPYSTNPGGAVSITRGKELLIINGCALCHTPTLKTGNQAAASALNNKTVNLY